MQKVKIKNATLVVNGEYCKHGTEVFISAVEAKNLAEVGIVELIFDAPDEKVKEASTDKEINFEVKNIVDEPMKIQQDPFASKKSKNRNRR